MAEELENYWKRPEPQASELGKQTPRVGLWSRSRLFRCVIWVVTIIAVLALSVVVSSFLSGFASPLEMFNWITESFEL
jgi:anti-sigma-K factor RskA